MQVLKLTPDVLIAEITAAFDGVQREDGTTLHEGEALDCHDTPEDRQRARLLDTDRRWQDIPDQWIGEFPSAFRFMDSKGLRYYLPRVMIWEFSHSHWSEPASADNLRTLLADTQFGYPQLPELLDLLTEPQRRATARWLWHYMDGWPEHDKQQLLASSWGKYLVE